MSSVTHAPAVLSLPDCMAAGIGFDAAGPLSRTTSNPLFGDRMGGARDIGHARTQPSDPSAARFLFADWL